MKPLLEHEYVVQEDQPPQSEGHISIEWLKEQSEAQRKQQIRQIFNRTNFESIMKEFVQDRTQDCVAMVIARNVRADLQKQECIYEKDVNDAIENKTFKLVDRHYGKRLVWYFHRKDEFYTVPSYTVLLPLFKYMVLAFGLALCCTVLSLLCVVILAIVALTDKVYVGLCVVGIVSCIVGICLSVVVLPMCCIILLARDKFLKIDDDALNALPVVAYVDSQGDV